MSDLLLTALHLLDVPDSKFGDSDGTLKDIALV